MKKNGRISSEKTDISDPWFFYDNISLMIEKILLWGGKEKRKIFISWTLLSDDTDREGNG